MNKTFSENWLPNDENGFYLFYKSAAIPCIRMILRECYDVLNCKNSTVCSIICLGYLQCPRYWPCVRVIHRSTMNFPHKGPLTRKAFSCHDVMTSFDSTYAAVVLHCKEVRGYKVLLSGGLLKHWAETNWSTLHRRRFQVMFKWALSNLDWNYTDICFWVSCWQ